MGTRIRHGSYSSDDKIGLVVNGERLNVAQVGRNELFLRDRRDILAETPEGHH